MAAISRLVTDAFTDDLERSDSLLTFHYRSNSVSNSPTPPHRVTHVGVSNSPSYYVCSFAVCTMARVYSRPKQDTAYLFTAEGASSSTVPRRFALPAGTKEIHYTALYAVTPTLWVNRDML